MLSIRERQKRDKENTRISIRVDKRKAKLEKRRNSILALVKTGIPLIKVGKRFGITKQRVNQIAIEKGISRWVETRDAKKTLYDNILLDMSNNLSIKEMVTKHNVSLSEINSVYKQHSNDTETITDKFRKKRNKKIVGDFIDGDTALVITKKTDKVLYDPTKITCVNGVYRITTKNGVKRYPQIGNRGAGGSFEKKSIIRYIVTKRERKNPLTYREITENLNALGYTTICGLKFNEPNVRAKYISYQNNKL